MSAGDPPIPSYGRLAVQCLGHPAWPVELDLKERSLATLFSKMERGQDLDWLRDRLEVQQVLAEVLGRAVSDVRGAIGQSAHPTQERFLRLDDVRFAREIDLSSEELPPGLPAHVLHPSDWGTSVWKAESGAGRSLLARWLKVRGLAHTRQLQSEQDLARLPMRGALFVDVSEELEVSGFTLSPAHLSELRAGKRPLLFALRRVPDALRENVIESPPVVDFLPELVHWISLRLDGSGHFEPERAENWIRKVAIPAGAIRTLGDALGLLGMLDEVSPRSLLAKSLDEIAAQFVSRRVREAQERTGQDPRLAEKVYPALKEASARLLVSESKSVSAPRSQDEWTRLLSSRQDQDLPDPSWFTEALRGALGSQISRRDLRRAAKHLDPSAFQISRSLSSSGLLRRAESRAESRAEPRAEPASSSRASKTDAEPRFKLGPQWIASLLEARAAQEALRLAPSQWGLVLLGAQPESVMVHLLRTARERELRAFFSVVDDFEEEIPELRAALEASVIALGLAEAEGHPVPEDLSMDILGLCGTHLLFIDGRPEPLFARQTAEPCWFERDHFLAALSVLLHRTRGKYGSLGSFSTWTKQSDPHFKGPLLRVLAKRRQSVSLAVGLLRVLEEFVQESEVPSALLWVRSKAKGRGQALLDALGLASLETLLRYAEGKDAPEAEVYLQIWKAESEEFDVIDAVLSKDDSPAMVKALYRHLPQPTLLSRIERKRRIDFLALLPHQFSAWLSAGEAPPMSAEAVAACPLEIAVELLEKRGLSAFTSDALVVLTRRGKGALSPYLFSLIQSNERETLRILLEAVPRDTTASLCAALPTTQALLQVAPELLTIIRKFLLRAVRERHSDFPECYRRLMKLEAGVASLRGLGA